MEPSTVPSSADAQPAAPRGPATGLRSRLFASSARQKLLAFASLIVLMAFFSIASSNFLQTDNLVSILQATAVNGVLAIACTLVPFALSLVAQRHLSAFTTALAVNMEPVYTIVLAILLLGEQHELSSSFYLGVIIVFAVVFTHPLWLAASSKKTLATSC